MNQKKKNKLVIKIRTEDGSSLIVESIQALSEDGIPIEFDSIQVNDQEFKDKILGGKVEVENKEVGKQVLEDFVASSSGLLIGNTIDQESSTPEVQSLSIPTEEIGEGYASLEEFGGESFYKTFWGSLTYEKIDEEKAKVSFEGENEVFDSTFVGKWLEPSRIHKCSSEYPETGRNYFPGALAVVYSRVLEVVDGKNLIVDFPYNGGDVISSKAIKNQDGIFFFDNKFAIESWSKSSKKRVSLKARSGQIYATLGMPLINVESNSSIKFVMEGQGLPPAIHLMMSDAFTGDKHGKGDDSSASFKETFGDNGSFFKLPDQGKVEIDFDWQFIPPTYSQKVVQYGSFTGLFFYDPSPLSSQYGLKRVRNYHQFMIRDQMATELGFIREGVTFSMPNQGYCNGGGIHDGVDIIEFCTYRFEGDWYSKDPNNMKARTSGGLRVEWIGKSKEQRGNFIELESLKAYRFDNLKMKFNSSNQIEVDDPNFTWYHLASQEWTGGTSTGYEASHLEIGGKRIGLNTNGDFWLVYGDEDLKGRDFSGKTVNIFDRIPRTGDVIRQNLESIKDNGLIGKVSDHIFEVWGWSLQEGDKLSYNGEIFNVIKTSRKWKSWESFSNQYPMPPLRMKRADRNVTYTEIELDKGIGESLQNIVFSVNSSSLEILLDGKFREDCSAVWNFGNDAPGHLIYTDFNVNLIMENINIHGMIRSTSKPIFAETTKTLKGEVSEIAVGNLGSQIWKSTNKLKLFHPETGSVQDIELIEDFNGMAGPLRIKPIHIENELPVGSIVVGLFSLCSEARFENVFFVNEDLSPCYSERIDYRPQGLRIRQLLTKDSSKRVKISGGRISWYSTINNRFEPEIELNEKPHLINPKSVVPVILNPVISDKNGAVFGFQRKESGMQEIFITHRVMVSNGTTVDLSNSVLASDLTLEGNGKFILDNVTTRNFVNNGKDSGVGFNLIIQDKFGVSDSLVLEGKQGKSAIMINSPYPIGVLKMDLNDWELKPGLFNNSGFYTKQNMGDPKHSEFIKIN
ncbi:hypothetical protein [Algoriphagus sp.]|uniref:hypothetical protein n=1 Tax=Algoriphagus sp. TaxID=1872435 RepID=UPI0025F246ED|nr:hypothetical protein [Algoriphagus sp.]